MSTTRDFSALVDVVTRSEVAEFRRRSRSDGRFARATGATALVVFAAASLVIILVGGSIIAALASLASDSFSPSAVIGPLGPLLAAAVILVVVAAGVAITVSVSRRRWERMLRQERFAAANGLVFSSSDSDPSYPGAIFQLGDSRTAVDHFWAPDGRSLDFGNYRYATGSGRNRTIRTWGFLALGLDRNLPHMLLDARQNNGLFGASNLPVSFNRDQVLPLEGDFDRHFTLYCPRAYERDALYVFTPDLMAVLIDEAASFDVEIIDQWMFVYSSTPFQMADPGTLDRLLRIVDTVGAKALRQTARYADSRATTASTADTDVDILVGDEFAWKSSGSVAEGGRRLTRRFPLAILVVVAAVVALALGRMFLGF